MTDIAWTSTGFIQKVTEGEFDRVPEFDSRSGDHLWIIAGAWAVRPEVWNGDNLPHLDRENLVSISGPGCWYCEMPWHPILAKRRCKGPHE